jgi:hypothetical protein
MKTIILLLSFIFTSCAVNMKTPSSRFLSPEVQGHIEGSISTGLSGSTNVELDTTDNKTDNPLQLSPDVSMSLVNLEVGIKDKVDVVFIAPSKSPSQLGIKFALVGKPQKRAEKGDHALSVFISGGREEETEVSDDIFFNLNQASATVETSNVVLGLLYGYRIDSETLIGANLLLESYDFKGSFTSGSNTNLVGKSFNYNGHITNFSLFALFYNKPKTWFTRIEAALQKSDWDWSAVHTFGYGNFAIGRTF